jgi:hypothetical protein
MTAPLKPGDVLHYRPSQHHCREGVALVVDGRLARDTYWGLSPGHDSHALTEAELDTATVCFNTYDYELLDGNQRHASRGKWETYHPDDRGRITSQQGLQEALFIRRGAKPDLDTQIANARAEVKKAEEEVRSAQRRLEWRLEDLAKLLDTQVDEGRA